MIGNMIGNIINTMDKNTEDYWFKQCKYIFDSYHTTFNNFVYGNKEQYKKKVVINNYRELYDFFSKKCENLYKTIQKNYDVWSLFLIGSIILCNGNLPFAILSLCYSYLINYIGHAWLHSEYTFYDVYSIPHCYHHKNDENFTYIVNIIAELSIALSNSIALKYIFKGFEYNPWQYLVNEWVTLFYYLIYTSVHYINYTYLKVNNYHTKHHEMENSNFGPDIIDGLFDTKHHDTPEPEETTHLIPNIIASFFVIYILKNIYTHLSVENKVVWENAGFCFWFTLFIFLIFASAIMLKRQVDEKIEKYKLETVVSFVQPYNIIT